MISFDTNQTCTIRPRWVDVNVTYVRGGLVTLETTQNLSDISITSSLLIQSAMSSLEHHFAYSQSMLGNLIMDTIEQLALDSPSQSDTIIEEKMVSAQYTMVISY